MSQLHVVWNLAETTQNIKNYSLTQQILYSQLIPHLRVLGTLETQLLKIESGSRKMDENLMSIGCMVYVWRCIQIPKTKKISGPHRALDHGQQPLFVPLALKVVRIPSPQRTNQNTGTDVVETGGRKWHHSAVWHRVSGIQDLLQSTLDLPIWFNFWLSRMDHCEPHLAGTDRYK